MPKRILDAVHGKNGCYVLWFDETALDGHELTIEYRDRNAMLAAEVPLLLEIEHQVSPGSDLHRLVRQRRQQAQSALRDGRYLSAAASQSSDEDRLPVLRECAIEQG